MYAMYNYVHYNKLCMYVTYNANVFSMKTG